MTQAPCGWVVHDYLQVNGGAERLVIGLANGLPGFGLGVSGIYPGFLESGDCRNVRPRVLGNPLGRLLPRVPRALAAFGRPPSWLRQADRVIYSGLYAPLAAPSQAQGKRIYYCHTPPRFAFDWQARYLERAPALARPVLRLAISRYHRAYLEALCRMDSVAVNSRHVRERLRRQTGVQAEVIYPPIDTHRFRFLGQADYYLSLGRLEPNKRIDRIVRAFLTMPDKRLVVASGGSARQSLQELARGASNIRFTGWLDDGRLAQLMGNAIAALYVPEDEDFGMSAVEAMAAGKPVIGVDEGGLKESVVDGATGILLRADPTPDAIVDAVRRMNADRAADMRSACEDRAAAFSQARFLSEFERIIQ